LVFIPQRRDQGRSRLLISKVSAKRRGVPGTLSSQVLGSEPDHG